MIIKTKTCMKQYIYIIGVALMMGACGQKAVVGDSNSPVTESEQLAGRLKALQQKGNMMGHQDDPF